MRLRAGRIGRRGSGGGGAGGEPQESAAGHGPPPVHTSAAPAREEPVAARDEAVAPRAAATSSRTREAGAAAIGTVGAGAVLLALLVLTAAVLIALLIALAILLADVGANPSNGVVKGLHESANFFAGSFTGMLRFSGHPKRAISVNWGIAAVVYLIVGAILARMIFIVGKGGVHLGERHRASAANY